ncbi:MAG: hypothetical protein J7L11_00940 [Thermoprotei archaeon]|nr:hypothetical protein [Thermoprotei archaeon]
MTLNPLHHAKAYELRKRYDLTYFDSLHASVAILDEVGLVGYDEQAYRGIEV